MSKSAVLRKENIRLGLDSVTSEEAIIMAGTMLVDSGCVSEKYIDAMFERERIVSTYIGNGVAIPHGVGNSRDLIFDSGIVVLQFPNGIQYNGNETFLVIGISAVDNDHIKILSNIAIVLSEEEQAHELWKTTDIDFVYNLFTEGNE